MSLAVISEPEPRKVNQGDKRRPNQFRIPLGEKEKVLPGMKGRILYIKTKKENINFFFTNNYFFFAFAWIFIIIMIPRPGRIAGLIDP